MDREGLETEEEEEEAGRKEAIQTLFHFIISERSVTFHRGCIILALVH